MYGLQCFQLHIACVFQAMSVTGYVLAHRLLGSVGCNLIGQSRRITSYVSSGPHCLNQQYTLKTSQSFCTLQVTPNVKQAATPNSLLIHSA